MFMCLKTRKRCSKQLKIKERLAFEKERRYIRKQKDNLKRKNLHSRFFQNSRVQRRKDEELVEKIRFKEGDRGSYYGSTRTSHQNKAYQRLHRQGEHIPHVQALWRKRRNSCPFGVWILCQTQYKKQRYDKAVQVIHWELCKTHDKNTC